MFYKESLTKKYMKNVLVTGGAGYIGSTLVPMLLEKNYNVTIVDKLLYENNHQFFLTPVGGTTLLRHPNFKKFIKGDIRDIKIVEEALEGQDFVIHLAAIVGAPACNKNPELARTTHIDGTKNILDSMNSQQKLVYASTGSNYGKVDGICHEDTPLNPLTLYGITKTEAEKMILDSGHVGYRFATAFGLSPRLRMDLLINDFSHRMTKGRHLDVYEAGAKRTFIHVFDISRALIFALENYDDMAGQVYNAGDEIMNISKGGAAELIKTAIEKKCGGTVNLWTEEGDSRFDPDKRDYEVSYAKIQSVANGFKTTVSLSDGIDELIEYYAKAFELKNPYSNV
jgi:nucleoside-diphosphate-sugar epimerase